MLKLLGDDSRVKLRGMFAPDGLQVFSVFDFLTIACAKNDKGAYARKWFGDNVKEAESPFHNEFVGQIYSFQFPGKTNIGHTMVGFLTIVLIIGCSSTTQPCKSRLFLHHTTC